MSTHACIAIVTGASKPNGIGLACVRQLALQYPTSEYNHGPLLIYLTARDKEKGEAALRSVIHQLHSTEIPREKSLIDVSLRLLDIESSSSIASFAASLAADHPGGVDILINNAGVLLDHSDKTLQGVDRTLKCNYYGTLAVTQALLPCIRDGGRIVNVASLSGLLSFGTYRMYSDEVRTRFLQAAKIEEITALVEDFSAAMEKEDRGTDWPPSSYSVSKAAVIGLTRVFARQLAKSKRRILINSCCPGIVATDMYIGRRHPLDDPNKPPQSPDEGARTPVLLALGDIEGTNGEFWREEETMEWDQAKEL